MLIESSSSTVFFSEGKGDVLNNRSGIIFI